MSANDPEMFPRTAGPIGGGEVGARIRARDWSDTPLGPRASWPHNLRAVVQLMLESPIPMALLWGRELTLLHNAAYGPLLADERVDALGRPFQEVWPEICALRTRVIAAVFERGESAYLEDTRHSIVRNGRRSEAYFTVSYAPVRDEDGTVGGILLTLSETTSRVRQRLDLESEREHAEAAAARGRELLARLIERIPVMVTISDPSLRSFHLNEELRRVLGWTDEDARMGDFMARCYPELEQRERARQFMECPEPGWREFEVTGKDGRRVVSSWANVRLPDDTRVGIGIDLRERKQSEAELKHALEEAEAGRQLLSSLMQNIPIGITVADAPDVRVRLVSRYGQELAGRVFEQFEGLAVGQHAQKWWMLRPDGAPFRDEDLPLARATLRGEHVREEEWLLARPDGTHVPILCTAAPILGAGGEILGGVVGWQDITERKRAEQLLRERKERLRLIIDATEIGTFDLDITTGHLEWSAHGKRHFGLAPDAEVNLDLCFQGIHPEDRARVRTLIHEALRPGGEGQYATEYRTVGLDDRKERWLIARGRVMFDAERRPLRFIGITADVTERRHAEGALRRANEQLREADRRKDEFLAILSHELRNPLAPIRNSLHILERAAPTSEQAARAKAIIERQVTHMTRLVADLLDVSRISRGKVQLQKERVDLHEVIGRALEDHRSAFLARRIELRTDQLASPVWVNGDPIRLGQAIGNLLHNAAKFTTEAGVVTVSLSIEEATAMVTVRDTGVGIAPEMLTQIFEPFTQADRTLDRSAGGLGLGLALVKGLIELHGGRVQATSDGPGHGARFTLRIPTTEGPALASRPELARAKPCASRILVIEDNIDAAMSLKTVLELEAHEVAVAHSGTAGLDMARVFLPEVVFCDIGLPGMDGYEVARAFRADEALRNIVLIALTGYALADDKRKAKSAGFDGHIAKPPDLAAIERILASLPARREA